jgi:hypothetical protein
MPIRGGTRAGSARRLTREHTPADPAERARVAAEGGSLLGAPGCLRVGGVLQVRACCRGTCPAGARVCVEMQAAGACARRGVCTSRCRRSHAIGLTSLYVNE